MPRIEQRVVVPVSADDAFALSQSQGDVRYAWDPFVATQQLLHGAEVPARGVQTLTKSKHRISMVSEYTAIRRPHQVGMKMVKGPPFFSSFGGGWAFKELDDRSCEAIWRYTFTIKPSWLSKVADPTGFGCSRKTSANGSTDLLGAAPTQISSLKPTSNWVTREPMLGESDQSRRPLALRVALARTDLHALRFN